MSYSNEIRILNTGSFKLAAVGKNYIMFTNDKITYFLARQDYESFRLRLQILEKHYSYIFNEGYPFNLKKKTILAILGIPESFLNQFDLKTINVSNILSNLNITEIEYDFVNLYTLFIDDQSKAIDKLASNILIENGIYMPDTRNVDSIDKHIIFIEDKIDKDYLSILNNPNFAYLYFYPDILPSFSTQFTENVLSIFKKDLNERCSRSLGANEEISYSTSKMYNGLVHAIIDKILYKNYINCHTYTSVFNLIDACETNLDLLRSGFFFDMYGFDKFYDKTNSGYKLNLNLTKFYLPANSIKSIKRSYNHVHQIFEKNKFEYIAIFYLKMMGLPYEAFKIARYFDFENGNADEFVSLFDIIDVDYRNKAIETIYINSSGSDDKNETTIKLRYLLNKFDFYISPTSFSQMPNSSTYMMFDFKKIPSFLKPYIEGNYKKFLTDDSFDSLLDSITVILNENDEIPFDSYQNDNPTNSFVQNHVVNGINTKIRDFFMLVNTGLSFEEAYNSLEISDEISFFKFFHNIPAKLFTAISEHTFASNSESSINGFEKLFKYDQKIHVDNSIIYKGLYTFVVEDLKTKTFSIPIEIINANNVLQTLLFNQKFHYLGFFKEDRLITFFDKSLKNIDFSNSLLPSKSTISKKKLSLLSKPLSSFYSIDKDLNKYIDIILTYAAGFIPLSDTYENILPNGSKNQDQTILKKYFDYFYELLKLENAFSNFQIDDLSLDYSSLVKVINDKHYSFDIVFRFINLYSCYDDNFDLRFTPFFTNDNSKTGYYYLHGRNFNAVTINGETFFNIEDKEAIDNAYKMIKQKFKNLNSSLFIPFSFYILGLPLIIYPLYRAMLGSKEFKLPSDFLNFTDQLNFDFPGTNTYMYLDRNTIDSYYENIAVTNNLIKHGILILTNMDKPILKYFDPVYLLNVDNNVLNFAFKYQFIALDFENDEIIDKFMVTNPSISFLANEFINLSGKNGTKLAENFKNLIILICFNQKNFIFNTLKILFNTFDLLKIKNELDKLLTKLEINSKVDYLNEDFINFLIRFVIYLLTRYIASLNKGGLRA